MRKTNAASNRVREKKRGKKEETMQFVLDSCNGFEEGDQIEGMGKP